MLTMSLTLFAINYNKLRVHKQQLQILSVPLTHCSVKWYNIHWYSCIAVQLCGVH